MAVDPLSAISNLGKTVLNKVFRDKVSEDRMAEIENEFDLGLLKESRKANSDFRKFVIEYEGAARDYVNLPVIGPIVLATRSLIRPAVTVATVYFDYVWFTSPTAWDPMKGKALMMINGLVLLFWFGERAIKNTNALQVLASVFAGKKE